MLRVGWARDINAKDAKGRARNAKEEEARASRWVEQELD
jgi:hypothetical protein